MFKFGSVSMSFRVQLVRVVLSEVWARGFSRGSDSQLSSSYRTSIIYWVYIDKECYESLSNNRVGSERMSQKIRIGSEAKK